MFECTLCHFSCKRSNNYKRHLNTSKHVSALEDSFLEQEKSPRKFVCKKCDKEYLARNSLWYHEQKCTLVKKENPTMMINELIKQNKELRDLLLEQNKQMIEMASKSKNVIVTNNNNHQTINQINNNKFNLNVFLNEKCKDALNISDFINSLQISMQDVEEVGESGFVEGISKIFINGLKQLDVYKRPIHCSDFKREVMHLKENNVWEKESEDKPKLIQAIQTIADKNLKSVPAWKKQNPESWDSESKKSDQYLKIMGQSLGACDKEKDLQNYHKIIKRVAKEVVIDKTTEES